MLVALQGILTSFRNFCTDCAPRSAPETRDIGWGYSTMSEPTKSETFQRIQTQTQPADYFQTMQGSLPPASSASLIRRQQFTVGEVWDQSRNSSSHYLPSPTTMQPSDQLPFGLIDILNRQEHPFTSSDPHIYSVNIPTPDVTPPHTRVSTPPLRLSEKKPSSTYTYSHDEPNFARRLTRSTLEKGFHLLCQAHIRLSRLNYVFRLSLPYLTLEQLRLRFKSMLSRSVNEDLDFWETPFLHLGGAGTHYPRKDLNGNILPKRNTWNIKQIGPLDKRVVRVENTADGRWEFITDMDLSAFQGEWFDAYDVQGYLEERWGCRIDSKSSFAEFAVDEEMAPLCGRVVSSDEEEETPGLTQSEASTSGAEEARNGEYGLLKHLSLADRTQAESVTPPFADAPFGLDMSFSNPPHPTNSPFSNIDLSFDQTLGLDLAPGYDYSYPSFNVDMNLGLDLMGGQVARRTKKKTAWLEVERLIDGE
jgi:hypothetical protein